MSRVGLLIVAGVGCAGLSGLHGEMDEEEAKQCILYALRRGINLIDTAPFYNERRQATPNLTFFMYAHTWL